MVNLPIFLTTNNLTCIDQVALADPCKRSCCESNYVDEYLFVEIFKRMPAKSVCRMRCVCKSWNSLISSPFFITGHHPLHHPKSYLLLKRVAKDWRYDDPDRGVPSYALYCPNHQGVPFDHWTTFKSLPFELSPFRTRQQKGPLFFFDVIHGVVCLSSCIEYPYHSDSPTILWNPSIHKYAEIPNSPFQFDGGHDPNQYAPSLGFGFNSHTNHFMVMRLWMPIQFHPHTVRAPQLPLLYKVFSPQDGGVKAAVASPIRPGKIISKASFFMNGTIHWAISEERLVKKIGRRRRPIECYRLLMFNCERDEFTTLKLPKRFNKWREDVITPNFFKFQGMLAVMIFSLSHIDFWVMEEYGVASSWKELPSCNEGSSEFHGWISHESMFLAEAKTQTFSYVKKLDNNDGKVYYEIDGRTCEHILV